MGKKTHMVAMLLLLAIFSVACRGSVVSETTTEQTSETKVVTVGFSQLGAESDWRSANTDSMLQALSKENGYNLIYKNGQQKQANQVTALRMFIPRRSTISFSRPRRRPDGISFCRKRKMQGSRSLSWTAGSMWRTDRSTPAGLVRTSNSKGRRWRRGCMNIRRRQGSRPRICIS